MRCYRFQKPNLSPHVYPTFPTGPTVICFFAADGSLLCDVLGCRRKGCVLLPCCVFLSARWCCVLLPTLSSRRCRCVRAVTIAPAPLPLRRLVATRRDLTSWKGCPPQRPCHRAADRSTNPLLVMPPHRAAATMMAWRRLPSPPWDPRIPSAHHPLRCRRRPLTVFPAPPRRRIGSLRTTIPRRLPRRRTPRTRTKC